MIQERVLRLSLDNAWERQRLIYAILFAFSNHNLAELYLIVGPDRFVKILDAFAGCHMKIPSGRRLHSLIDRYQLTLLRSKVKTAPPQLHRECEGRYDAERKRLKVKGQQARRICKETRKLIQEAEAWWEKKLRLDKKHKQAVIDPIRR